MCENSASADGRRQPPARASPGDETLSPDEDASSSDRAARRDGARGTLGGGVRRAPTTARRSEARRGPRRAGPPRGPRDAASPPPPPPLATAARPPPPPPPSLPPPPPSRPTSLSSPHLPRGRGGLRSFRRPRRRRAHLELLARLHPLPTAQAPARCTNAHAQTLIGYARMLTLFLKYDRQLVRTEDGGQVSRRGSRAIRSTSARPGLAGVRGRLGPR